MSENNIEDPQITIDQVTAQDFRLSVLVDGRNFDCGSYLTRMTAMQAAKLLIERKLAESKGQKKRPRKK
jgi:hypothetical protein